MKFLVAGALLLSTASAHFRLDLPRSTGFTDESEGDGPCGGNNPDLSNTTDFHVGGDAISVFNTHPTANFLYRITPNANVSGNFTVLRPVTQQSGLGNMCLPSVSVPASFAGTKGVLQVIGNGADGVLYQCASLNFVSGTGTPDAATCRNGSGVTVSFVSDSTLSPLSSSGNSTAATSAAATTSASPTASHNAAAGLRVGAGSLEGVAGGVALLLLAGVAGVVSIF